MLLAASLSSCSAAASAEPKPSDPVKTTANANYRTPSVQGPVPRNPDMAFELQLLQQRGLSFSRVPVSGNYIAMTFDDGPHPQNTPRLLDILRARNIKATFFVIGRSVDLYPQIVRRTVAEGHEIGNHTYTHRLLTKLSDSEIRNDLTRCRDAVARAAGVATAHHAPALRRPAPAPARNGPRRIRLPDHPLVGRSARLETPRPSVVTSRILSGTTPVASSSPMTCTRRPWTPCPPPWMACCAAASNSSRCPNCWP